MFKKFFLVFTLLIASGFIAKHAFAITMIPPSLEFDVTPNQQYKTTVKLFNEEERALNVYSSVANFGQQGETGLPSYDLNAPVTEGLASWIEVEKGPLTIEPGERIEVIVTINPPKTAEPGGHYAGVFFTENNPNETTGNAVGVTKGVGVLLLAKVAGEIKESGAIVDFVTDAQKYSHLPVQFSVRYQNTGNVHIRPSGSITITDMFGRSSGTIEVNTIKGATLPLAIRKYDATWEKSQNQQMSGSAWNQFWQAYRNEKTNLGFGKYTATLSLTAGRTGQVQNNAEISFWIWPWHMILVYAVIIVVAILVLWLLIRSYNRWLTKKVLQAKNIDVPVVKEPAKPSKKQSTSAKVEPKK